MTNVVGRFLLTLGALIAAGAGAWHGPRIAAALGLSELSLVAGLIAAIAALTALERLYDWLAR